MPITKTITLADGVVLAYHRAVRVAWTDTPMGAKCIVTVNSWVNQAQHDAGADPYRSEAVPDVPLTPQAGIFAAAEAALVATAGPWSGGTVAAVASGTALEAAQARRWAEIKVLRDIEIAEPKMTSVGMFDATPEDQNNLSKVIALVQIAAARALPAQANYTLADNTRVTLTLAELEQAALEMGAQVQALHDQGIELYEAIYSAETVEDVEAVTWD